MDEDEGDIPEQALPYLFLKDDEPAFRLAEAVYVTQADVRKLQLGKGAIAAGVQVLLDAYGVPCGQVGGLLLAGGFGSYIRPESAARIGLIPKELLPVTKAIGNAAAEGRGRRWCPARPGRACPGCKTIWSIWSCPAWPPSTRPTWTPCCFRRWSKP